MACFSGSILLLFYFSMTEGTRLFMERRLRESLGELSTWFFWLASSPSFAPISCDIFKFVLRLTPRRSPYPTVLWAPDRVPLTPEVKFNELLFIDLSLLTRMLVLFAKAPFRGMLCPPWVPWFYEDTLASRGLPLTRRVLASHLLLAEDWAFTPAPILLPVFK